MWWKRCATPIYSLSIGYGTGATKHVGALGCSDDRSAIGTHSHGSALNR